MMYDLARKYRIDLIQKSAIIIKLKTNSISPLSSMLSLIAALDKNDGKRSRLGLDAKVINGLSKPILKASKIDETVKQSNKNISFIFELERTYKIFDKYSIIFYVFWQSLKQITMLLV